MGDLISRQAVNGIIDALFQNKNSTLIASPLVWYALKEIQELPSSNTPNALEALKMRWISCSERLPEYMQKVLISTRVGRVHQGRYNGEENINRWYSFVDRAVIWNHDVTAWQPLPEPFKERKE